MKFEEAFTKLLGHEGGYVNNPKDPGGETIWGISKRSYPTLHIPSLTQYDAMAIYKRDFWDKCKCDELPEDIRFDVFDGAVNSGNSQSIKWLQRAIGAIDDGVIGPKTIALAQIQIRSLQSRYNGQRLMFMTNLTTWPEFGAGWARRIAANLQTA